MGREGQTLFQLWPESSNSRKQMTTPWNPEGEGGFSLSTSGILSGEKWEPDPEQSKGEEGHFSRTALRHMLEALSVMGREETGMG